MMTIKEALHRAVCTLEAACVPDPQIDAELLLMHVTGLDRMSMRLNSTIQLTMEQEQRLASLLLSRAQRKPLQYLLGIQYFYGLPFAVDDRVLIPRQETESLCELGIQYLRTLKKRATVLDLCTGSGAIAVTLKHEHPSAEVTACDLSSDALVMARQNARDNGAEVQFLQGDLWEPAAGMRFDLILSNPPYIPSLECDKLQTEVMQEPRMALDGGEDGLDFYRRIAQGAAAHMTPGGLIAVEAGDGESNAIAVLFASAGLQNVTVHNDLYGMPRIVSGRAKE